jgi:hypothetical protein
MPADPQPEASFQGRTAYVVGPPWGEGNWIVLDDPDPHQGVALVDCDQWDRESYEEYEFTAQQVAAEITHRWNEWAEMRASLRALTRAFIGFRYGEDFDEAMQVLARIAAREEHAKGTEA